MIATFVDILRHRAEATPDRLAFEFDVPGVGHQAMTYAQLDARATAVAALIGEHSRPGSRVLLMHQPGPEYVTAFFGCLYSAAIAVPAYPPLTERGMERVRAIAADCGAQLALTDPATLAAIDERVSRRELSSALAWMTTDGTVAAVGRLGRAAPPAPGDLAFLQYTSGSTGTPKGVMLSHGNLMSNSMAIAGALRLDEASRGVSWLPPYHDMGLIGGILQPVYTGFPCTLLSPLTFAYNPMRWLQELSRTKASVTAGPDFAYAEVTRRSTDTERAGLDLSALRHALVGAEPVRSSTLAAFADAFCDAGFRRSAFYPCYGLAEATLFVAGDADPGAGATVIRVARSGLEAGRITSPDDGSAADLVGCGWAHQEDIALIVDPESTRPVPDEIVGEIWVSGPSVARGYWQRPQESAAAFGAAALGYPGRPFLRTGDLGFRHDGRLYVTGRIKDLIIVHGRNYYPADVELTAQRAHPLLEPGRGAAFAVDGDQGEGAVLVHEVTRHFEPQDGPAVAAAVRAAVAAEHGLALVDIVLARRGSIPRTSSGKIRRRECRARWLTGELAVAAISLPAAAPGPGALPDDLAAVIAAALDVSPSAIAADVPLIAQGLDSLRAVRLLAALRDHRGLSIPLSRLLDDVTPLDLVRLPSPGVPSAGRPAPGTAAEASQVTPAQERIWLLTQMGAGGAYHIAGGLRLRGELDPALLTACLTGVLDAVPALRSAYVMGEDGTLARVPRPAPDVVELPVHDVSGPGEEAAQAAMKELAAQPFDLSTGPLMRFVLLRLGAREWMLGMAAHHIAVDGWAMGVLLARLGDAYAAGGPPTARAAPPARSATAASWGPGDLTTWRAELAGSQPLDLPTDRPAPTVPSWEGASVPVTLPGPLAERVRALAAEWNVTPFMVLLTALGILLGRWSGQDDLLLGTVVAGRDRDGTEPVIGMLANTLPIRVQTARADFRTVLARVRARCLRAYANAHVPFDEIVHAVAGGPPGGRAPLVRAVLVLQNLPLEPWQARGVRAEPFELPSPGAQFELSVHLSPAPDGALAGHASYATDLFDERTIEALLAGLPVLLDAALSKPATPATDLPLQPPAGAARVAALADGGPPVADGGLVHQLIRQSAEASPDTVAVAGHGGQLTYRELDRAARGLAARLRSLGVTADQQVAVCVPRSPDLIVVLYAVLLAGGAYLPLEPGHPPSRRAQQLADSGARILIGIPPDHPLPPGVLVVSPQERADTAPVPGVRAGNLANILYTSGSTGRPKAVMTSHAALANRLLWMSRAYGLNRGERVLHKTPVSFDVAGWELLWPLTAGATVVLARPEGHRDPSYLARLIVRHNVTTCHFVPSMLRAFLEDADAARLAGTALRRVLCSGEELVPSLARRFRDALPGTTLHNLYGPTEAAIDVTAHEVREADRQASHRIPIGAAIPGARLYVLEPSGAVAPALVPGELYIGGLAPARGYLGNPALTAERFEPDPHCPGGRRYRTGDRARMLPNGSLEYLGRLDRQLKIRGQRVEPAEIEAALSQHPMVAAAVVDGQADPSGQIRLVAWVVPGHGDAPSPRELRQHLAQLLPAGLVPDAMVLLPRLPVGPHGKLDRSALPPPATAPVAVASIVPRNAVERTIAGIWSEVLGIPAPSVTADFFQLGGHSLMATRVAVRIRSAFGVELPVAELLSGSLTIERLAALVQDQQVAQAGADEVGSVLGWLSTLSDQQVRQLLSEDQAT